MPRQESPAALSARRIVQAARKPNSVLSDHSSRRVITEALQQPTRKFRPLRSCEDSLAPHLNATGRHATSPEEGRQSPCLFGLAPCGVYHAAGITAGAVGSYPTLSPLPRKACMSVHLNVPEEQGELILSWRFAFCCTGRNLALTPDSRTLSGTLPCGVRTFLPHSTPRLSFDRSGPSGSDRPAACIFSLAA